MIAGTRTKRQFVPAQNGVRYGPLLIVGVLVLAELT
jgi:hypothetical protein